MPRDDDTISRGLREARDDVYSKIILDGWFGVPHRPQSASAADHDPSPDLCRQGDSEPSGHSRTDDDQHTLADRFGWARTLPDADRDIAHDHDIGIDR